jgi:hypothetical protein
VPAPRHPPEVANGSLNDEDIGRGTFVAFQGNIGNVPAQDCEYRDVTGINAQGDHLCLRPDFGTTAFNLDYGIQYRPGSEFATIVICNPTGAAINDGLTTFNLLVIDAQQGGAQPSWIATRLASPGATERARGRSDATRPQSGIEGTFP